MQNIQLYLNRPIQWCEIDQSISMQYNISIDDVAYAYLYSSFMEDDDAFNHLMGIANDCMSTTDRVLYNQQFTTIQQIINYFLNIVSSEMSKHVIRLNAVYKIISMERLYVSSMDTYILHLLVE